MPKLRRPAHVRSMKSIAVKVKSKIYGRKSGISVNGLSASALLKEANHISRLRDKNKILSEVRKRGLIIPYTVMSTETI